MTTLNPAGMDPRVIKELLQLQMLSKSSLVGGSDAAGDEEFSELLKTLVSMQSTAETADKPAGTVAIKPALSPLTGSAVQAGSGVSAAAAVRTAGSSAPTRKTDFEAYIQSAAAKHGVEPSLVKAVIDAESSFNPQAVSKAGAKGLMQLMDATGQGLGVKNPLDPEQNIHGGTLYLSGLLKKYNGNTGMALAAYNGGPARIQRLGIRNDAELMAKLDQFPKETQGYVRKVMNLQEKYKV